jgi:hypothetical protein
MSRLELDVQHFARSTPYSSFGIPSSPPKTIVEVCCSGSISHLAAKRIFRSSATTASPNSGSVSSRKSSSSRRQTRSVAITRAFGVNSSASHTSPTASASTSFETIRCR